MPAAAEPLYIAVETFHPIQFRELQTAADRGGELVFSTIRATAAHSAQLVGYPGEVRTLDEGAKAPAGAVVLRLTWKNARDVTADITRQGREKFLGLVSVAPLLDHPEHQRLTAAVSAALLPDARRDALVRAETEKNLYLALKYAVREKQLPGKL